MAKKEWTPQELVEHLGRPGIVALHALTTLVDENRGTGPLAGVSINRGTINQLRQEAALPTDQRAMGLLMQLQQLGIVEADRTLKNRRVPRNGVDIRFDPASVDALIMLGRVHFQLDIPKTIR